MESPRDIQDSKRFRWVGRPSEEQLLGPPLSGRRPTAVSLQPSPHPAPLTQAPVDPFEAAPRWRFERRDLLALAAIAVAVWFAIRGAEGLPFHQSGPLSSAAAADQVTARVTLDRNELRSIPRAAATAGSGRAGSRSTNGTGPRKAGPAAPGSGTKGHPKPPSSGGAAPLLQVPVPGVGTVIVDDPEVPLPDEPPADLPLPPLPDTGQVTLATPTLP
jgi:hypothetical protein